VYAGDPDVLTKVEKRTKVAGTVGAAADKLQAVPEQISQVRAGLGCSLPVTVSALGVSMAIAVITIPPGLSRTLPGIRFGLAHTTSARRYQPSALHVLASALQFAGIMPSQGPAWYVALQAVVGLIQVVIALAMLAGYRKAGVWGTC
jgi:hypothetical protein